MVWWNRIYSVMNPVDIIKFGFFIRHIDIFWIHKNIWIYIIKETNRNAVVFILTKSLETWPIYVIIWSVCFGKKKDNCKRWQDLIFPLNVTGCFKTQDKSHSRKLRQWPVGTGYHSWRYRVLMRWRSKELMLQEEGQCALSRSGACPSVLRWEVCVRFRRGCCQRYLVTAKMIVM